MTTISDISRIGIDLLKLKPIEVQKEVYDYSTVQKVGVDLISVTSRMSREEGRRACRESFSSAYPSAPLFL